VIIGVEYTAALRAALQGYKDTFGDLNDLEDVAATLSRSLFVTWGNLQMGVLEDLLGNYIIDQVEGAVAMIHRPCGMGSAAELPVETGSILRAVYSHAPECPITLQEQLDMT
jgi:hypothetical protein